MTDSAQESTRKPRNTVNDFCEFSICKHCGKKIGHRPHTRSWEHINPNPRECDYPFPEQGSCLGLPWCDGCKQQKKRGKKN